VTADRRLRIGGWAALLVAVLAPLQMVALWLDVSAFDLLTAPDPWSSQPYLALDVVRAVAVLVAAVGLDGLFRSLDPSAARTVLRLGVAGTILGLVADTTLIGGLRLGAAESLVALPGDLLIAAWFLGGGLILLRSGGQLARIGWTAALGGAGLVLVAISVAVRFGGTPGVTGTALIDWFMLLGLFVVIYLVRIWRYVVGGRMPGPGIV
jgi:hypothetical protein